MINLGLTLTIFKNNILAFNFIPYNSFFIITLFSSLNLHIVNICDNISKFVLYSLSNIYCKYGGTLEELFEDFQIINYWAFLVFFFKVWDFHFGSLPIFLRNRLEGFWSFSNQVCVKYTFETKVRNLSLRSMTPGLLIFK